MWASDYIGIPFKPDGRDREGLDCWGIVCLVYREQLGVELPLHPGAYPDGSQEALHNAASVAKVERERWKRVDVPQPYDVALLRLQGLPCHVGVVVSKGIMLHAMAGIESCLERYTGPHWKDRIEGYFRYAG